MKIKLTLTALTLLVLSTIHYPLSTVFAQGTAFTYQGRLNADAGAANGSYDLQFAIYDASTNGNLIAGPLTNSATGVSNGLFQVLLDFGSAPFASGAPRWLDIAVRTNSGAAFTVLAPRQMLAPTPYAIYSGLAGVATSANGVAPGSIIGADIAPGTIMASNIAAGQVVKGINGFSDTVALAPGSNIAITPSGNALLVSTFGTWNQLGNGGTSPTNGNFVGTTDFQPLELKAGRMRILRLEPDPRGDIAGNLIGGSTNNTVEQPGSGGNVIGGGGYLYGPNILHSYSQGVFIGAGSANQIGPRVNDSFIGAGYGNTILSFDSVIVGGTYNTVSSNATYSAIGGGSGNSAAATYATVGGGYNNSISNSPNVASTIAGGYQNTIRGSGAIGGGAYNAIGTGPSCTIGGGYGNGIADAVNAAVIGGGAYNNINADASTISGGTLNSAHGTNATVSGGYGNSASGAGSTVSGGTNNTAGGAVATVGGGANNTANGNNATIGGGAGNIVGGPFATVSGGIANSANGINAAVGGGFGNSASGIRSTVPGGDNNVAAGDYSFAAGLFAQANHNNSFVWSDGSADPFASTSANQFAVSAAGGVVLAADVQLTGGAAYHNLSLSGGNSLGFLYGSYPRFSDGIHLGYNYYANAAGVDQVIHPDGGTSRITAGYGFIRLATANPFAGAPADPGQLVVTPTSVTMNVLCNNCSDRNVKQDFAPISAREVLDRVAQLQVSEWSYKVDPATRHIGPMAQDFHSAFRIGTDDKHIATIDEGGVALAAIQGLNQKLEQRTAVLEEGLKQTEAQNAQLKRKLEEKNQEVLDLERRLERLEHVVNQGNGGGI